MPTLRNTVTGAVVSCSDEAAARLGAEWKPVGEKAAEQAEKKAAPRRRRKTEKAEQADAEDD